MAFTIVHTVSSAANGAASIVQAITSTTSGNLLLIAATCSNTTVVMTPTVSGGTAQTFTSIGDLQPGTGQLQAWYVPNCAGGTTSITVTRASGTGQWAIIVTEISGAATASPLDKSATATTSGNTGTTATTTQAGEFWWALFMGADAAAPAATISGVSAGWTGDQNVASTLGGANTDVTIASATQIVSSTGAANATATVTNAAANGTAGIVATFKAAAVTSLPPSLKTFEQAVNRAGVY